MIRRTTKYLAMTAIMGCTAYANAGSALVTPALAACGKALVESIVKSAPLPAYTIKSPGLPSSLVDPNAFTVLAHSKKTNELIAKASCKATPEGEIVTFKSLPVS